MTTTPLQATNIILVIVYTFVSLLIMLAVGLAVVGNVKMQASKEWQQLAEARLQRIAAQEQEIQALRVEVTALKGQLSEMQRINWEMQKQLDKLTRAIEEKG